MPACLSRASEGWLDVKLDRDGPGSAGGRGQKWGPRGGESPDAASQGAPPCSLFFVNIILHFKDELGFFFFFQNDSS